LKTWPKEACSTVLAEREGVLIFAFRRDKRLPLRDCLYAFLPSIPLSLTDKVFPQETFQEVNAIAALSVPSKRSVR
jgi:hypothetical protein